MSDTRPIGVFDSGLGGLCALKELRRILPRENIIYFGDTGRVPYGSKSDETICRYANEDVDFLSSYGVKAILAACGTVSSVALDKIKSGRDTLILGVCDDAVNAALRATKNGIVGVIGTAATVRSRLFEKKLTEKQNVKVISKACPLFVSLVECGFSSSDAITKKACADYLCEIKSSGADTLILGCTHFPIISDAIAEYLPGVTLVNPAREAARSIACALANEKMLSSMGGKTSYFVSDDAAGFSHSAETFLGAGVSVKAERVRI
ncbi:MAG: glutamate racemase [Clostridiales bacterium]|nr:glutamate racemase [Clostridiales bacterium]